MKNELTLSFNSEEEAMAFAAWLTSVGIQLFAGSNHNDGGAHIQSAEYIDTDPTEINYIEIGS